MGLFSLFSKRKPEEIYKSIAQKIVLAALCYRQEISAPNNKVSAETGAEMVYLLIHHVDRQAFVQLGPSQRDKVIDKVAQIAIADCSRAVLTADAPQELLMHNQYKMVDTLNSRQIIYSQCKLLLGKEGDFCPGIGTVVFAFCFFVHRALGHTVRTDVDDILIGKRDIVISDMGDFPTIDVILLTTISVGSILTTLRIPDDLRHLK